MKPGSGRFALVAVCLLFARAAWAAPPADSYTLDVGGDNEIWFPSGSDLFCTPGNEVCISSTVGTDATGAVAGTGEMVIAIPEIDGDLTGALTGKLSGSARNPNARITATLKGPGTVHDATVGDISVEMSTTVKLTCRDPLPRGGAHASTFQCRGSLRLCAEAFGRRFCQGAGGLQLEIAAAGGPWTLELNGLVTGLKGAVDGAATATLANGAFENFEVTGKYNAKPDQSNLRVVPLDPKLLKDRLNLNKFRVDDMGGVLGTVINFKVAGETGRAVILPPP